MHFSEHLGKGSDEPHGLFGKQCDSHFDFAFFFGVKRQRPEEDIAIPKFDAYKTAFRLYEFCHGFIEHLARVGRVAFGVASEERTV